MDTGDKILAKGLAYRLIHSLRTQEGRQRNQSPPVGERSSMTYIMLRLLQTFQAYVCRSAGYGNASTDAVLRGCAIAVS